MKWISGTCRVHLCLCCVPFRTLIEGGERIGSGPGATGKPGGGAGGLASGATTSGVGPASGANGSSGILNRPNSTFMASRGSLGGGFAASRPRSTVRSISAKQRDPRILALLRVSTNPSLYPTSGSISAAAASGAGATTSGSGFGLGSGFGASAAPGPVSNTSSTQLPPTSAAAIGGGAPGAAAADSMLVRSGTLERLLEGTSTFDERVVGRALTLQSNNYNYQTQLEAERERPASGTESSHLALHDDQTDMSVVGPLYPSHPFGLPAAISRPSYVCPLLQLSTRNTNLNVLETFEE